MARDKARRGANKASGRDSGGFVALPWTVLDCPKYSCLSHPARSLLIEIARQYIKDNNGRLLASSSYLKPRGWNSTDVIQRAKKDLIEGGFIYETVKGHRPNKASWYAITWQDLDKDHRYDARAWEGWKEARSGYKKNLPLINKSLTPSHGIATPPIDSSGGVMSTTPIPLGGAIRATFTPSPIPSNGNHLDIPSNIIF
jgi:hypothetical protein|tara:strand:- start:2082 stop:2678 length:597 start_codon:yes stop_codon:yes gene_type:complete